MLLVSELSTKEGHEGMQEFGEARIHPGGFVRTPGPGLACFGTRRAVGYQREKSI